MKGDPLETLKNLRKKSHNAEKTCTQNFLVMGGIQTHVLLDRPQKSLIKLYAKCQVVSMQLVEAS